MKPTETLPRFFGSTERQLFGVYHAPAGTFARESGVVLCYPGPQEYSQVHWAFQKLAGLLAATGLHVLRFDYSSVGDSAGESGDGSLGRWCEDIETATHDLRELAGIRRVAIVGMRLGGVLAVRAAARDGKIRDVVLWDPIVSGPTYLRELDSAEAFRRRLLNYPAPDKHVADELLGYPFPAAQRSDTAAIDLSREPLGKISRLLVVGAALSGEHDAFVATAEQSGVDASVMKLVDPFLHATGKHPTDPILSHRVPVAIAEYLAARSS